MDGVHRWFSYDFVDSCEQDLIDVADLPAWHDESRMHGADKPYPAGAVA